ncbi:MAG: SHOCT domain-containing protein [Desulfobulbaceae bacterium]
MWNCNLGVPFTHGSWLGHGPFGLLLHILLAVVLIYVLIRIGRTIFVRNGADRDSSDSLEILRARFARGEISAEEYQRMREILRL